MEYSEANTAHRRYTIGIMGEYQQEDTRGKRVAWARKRLGLKAKQLAAQVGIGYIYLSKIENDNANPTPDVMRKLAAELRVSRAFLEMETDAPDPLPNEPAALEEKNGVNYISEQADEAAQLIDAMRDNDLRDIALDLVRVVAMYDSTAEDNSPAKGAGGAGGLLILSKLRGNLKKASDATRTTPRINSE